MLRILKGHLLMIITSDLQDLNLKNLQNIQFSRYTIYKDQIYK